MGTMATFSSFDGRAIAYRTFGPENGRATLLLHGFLANAEVNWIAPGVTAALAASGRFVITPDLRGHGASAAPQDPDAYPPDALAQDQEALLSYLGVTSYDLVGYSLGARTAIRMLVRAAKPGRAVLAGMGQSAVDGKARRAAFHDWIVNGAAAVDGRTGAAVQAFLGRNGIDPQAALGVQGSIVDTPIADLAAIKTPILCLSGDRDFDNGSAEILASYFPHASARRVKGDHMSTILDRDFCSAILSFLNGPPTS